MSNVTPQYIKDHFPGLVTTESDSYITLMIGWAEQRVDSTIWGCKEDQGVGWLTAHYIATSPTKGGGASGSVSGEKVGDQQINYSSPSNPATDDSLKLTSYGLQFLALQRTLSVSPNFF